MVWGVAVLWACVSYARSKGEHWAWGLLGIFWIVGFVVLFLLEDRSTRPPRRCDLTADPLIRSKRPQDMPWMLSGLPFGPRHH